MDALGLDLSLRATGYASGEAGAGVIATDREKEPMRRLAVIREAVLDLALGVDVVAIEQYGRLQGPATAIAELHGVVKIALWQRRTPFVLVVISSMKKFATGHGNADKVELALAASRRFGFEGTNDNAADAWLLREMALAHYEQRKVARYQSDVLVKVKWPRLDLPEGKGVTNGEKENPGSAYRNGDRATRNRAGGLLATT